MWYLRLSTGGFASLTSSTGTEGTPVGLVFYWALVLAGWGVLIWWILWILRQKRVTTITIADYQKLKRGDMLRDGAGFKYRVLKAGSTTITVRRAR